MKLLDEGFLPGLYAKKVAEYVVANLDVVASNLEKFGPQVTVGTLKAIPDRQHPNSAIGDEVHEAIEKLITSRNPPEPEFNTVTAKHMFESFWGLVKQERPNFVRSECTVWSYKHGYAGTADLLWDIPSLGGLGVVDVKTGMRIWPKTGMQTAALANADSLITVQGTEIDMPAIAWQGILHVRPRSAKLYVLQNVEENFQAFLACLTLFNWTRRFKDGIVPDRPVIAYPPQAELREWDGVRRWAS